MCGIVGFVSDKPNEQLINNMLNSIRHRGPDESNYEIHEFGEKFLHIGSSRLSITGLEDGSMPMTNSKGNVLVFNGEIYELSGLKKLIKNLSQTTSDTRHLIEFLSENHPKEIHRLNGMFAFVFFNKSEKNLVLSRDRLGIKPLYYSSNEKFQIAFSSEIKPLIEHSFIKKEIFEEEIQDYLLFGGFNSHSKAFGKINIVRPGSFLKLDQDGKILDQNYLDKQNNTTSESYDSKEFLNICEETIKDQLLADVPIDLLLSGGIDSSLLAMLIYNQIKQEVNSFTLSFDNLNMDEYSKAEIVTKSLGINTNKISYPSNKNNEIIEELFEVIPEPIADPSIVPTYYLCKKVSEKTKSVISGDGGDELFGGYDWYRASKIKNYIPNRSSLKLIEILSRNLKNSSNISMNEKVQQFTYGYNKKFMVDVLFWQNNTELFSEDYLIKKYSNYLDEMNLNNSKKDLNKIRELDMVNYLYSNILKKSDIASMLNGLEIRPVFLDNRIVNYAKRLNLNSNVTVFKGKNNMRQLLKEHLPKIARYSKQGFSHDFNSWTNDIGMPFIKKYENDFEFVSNYFSHSINNKNPYLLSRTTWSIYSILKWVEVNKLEIR